MNIILYQLMKDCTPEELKEAGIPEGLVRVSAGLENKEDILADVEQALAQI